MVGYIFSDPTDLSLPAEVQTMGDFHFIHYSSRPRVVRLLVKIGWTLSGLCSFHADSSGLVQITLRSGRDQFQILFSQLK